MKREFSDIGHGHVRVKDTKSVPKSYIMVSSVSCSAVFGMWWNVVTGKTMLRHYWKDLESKA